MRFRCVPFSICLTLVFTIPMRVTDASHPPRILVSQSSEVNLSVKVTNTGTVY